MQYRVSIIFTFFVSFLYIWVTKTTTVKSYHTTCLIEYTMSGFSTYFETWLETKPELIKNDELQCLKQISLSHFI